MKGGSTVVAGLWSVFLPDARDGALARKLRNIELRVGSGQPHEAAQELDSCSRPPKFPHERSQILGSSDYSVESKSHIPALFRAGQCCVASRVSNAFTPPAWRQNPGPGRYNASSERN